jgi:putative peptidoglycan binding protein
MRSFRRGSKGAEVSRMQHRLQELGLYRGAIDGDFGGETEIAVRRFQRDHGMQIDGVVGSETWRALFPAAVDLPAPELLEQPIAFRCLALTGAFETTVPPPGCFAAVAGNFDGQGISFGALQFNLGKRTLQTILVELDRRHPQVMEDTFHDKLGELRAVLATDVRTQLAFARSIQDPSFRLHDPWRGMFRALGRAPECQSVQLEQAASYMDRATQLCERFDVSSSRALALMFDIMVQNGGISAAVGTQIRADGLRLDSRFDAQARELELLRIIANRRAEAAKARWVEDVRRRKLCIANGKGEVHGSFYDLEEYGLTLDAAAIV